MKKEFTADAATMLALLKQKPGTFIKTFNQNYYLNVLAVEVFKDLSKTPEQFEALLKNAEIEDDDITAILQILDDCVNVPEELDELLAKVGRFDLLVRSERCASLLSRCLYQEEICRQYKELGLINPWHQKKCRTFVEKCEDWKTLAYFDDVYLLDKHKRYEEMQDGGRDCLNGLYEQGFKDLILKRIREQKANTCKRPISAIQFLMGKGAYELLSSGRDWELIFKEFSFLSDEERGMLRICLFLHVAICKEARGEEDAYLWRILIGEYYFPERLNLEYLRDFGNPEAMLIWIYNHITKYFPNVWYLYRIKKSFPLFSKMRRRFGSPKWQGTLAEITEKLLSKK